ncbi:MAG: ABC transporter permease [Candidatus Dormibacteria bacterium]
MRAVRRSSASAPRGLLVPAGLAVLFVLVPLVGLLAQVSWGSLLSEVTSPAVVTAALLSLECSTLAVACSVVIGVPLAHVLARSTLPGRRLLRPLVLLPLVLPPVVGGIALQTAFSRQTPIGSVLHDALGVTLPFSTAGAVMAETFVAFPFLVITVEAALRQRDLRYEEVAATLGARPWRRFWHVTMPLLGPALGAGAALCWARALGEFGATITFAGSFPGTTETLPLAAYTAYAGSGSVQRATTLSLILLAMSVAVLLGLRNRWFAVSR